MHRAAVRLDALRSPTDPIRMASRSIVVLWTALLAIAVCAWSQEAPSGVEYSFLRDPDFWLATGTNLVGISLFVSRVRAPDAARWFGYGTQLLGLPALALGLTDIFAGTADLSTWANLGYAAWALGAAVVDHVLDIEYRNPRNPAILIPYVATYYVAIGAQAAVLLDKGVAPWAIAGAVCIANVMASFYARAHGAD
jgi:hypothetical protein